VKIVLRSARGDLIAYAATAFALTCLMVARMAYAAQSAHRASALPIPAGTLSVDQDRQPITR
jgi:hypothetical protein